MYDFKFADIGEGIHEGTVLKWNYKVGDKVNEGDTLCVVETDKVNAELPSPVTGIITQIGKKEGETIHVGETVVIIDDGKGGSVEPVNVKKTTPEVKSQETSQKGAYDFKFADIGEGIHEGTILTWNYKVGDKVSEGDTLCVVETDKVNAELPSPISGTILKIGKNAGEIIHVGETVVLIGEPGDSLEQTPAPKEEKGSGVVGEIEVSSKVMAASTENVQTTQTTTTSKALATPVARALAKDLGIDINKITGTGANGRVLTEDILASKNSSQPTASEPAPKQAVSQPQASKQDEVIKISRLRKAISKQMTIAKQEIPHCVLMDEINVNNLVKFRNDAKAIAESKGVKLTYLAFIMKAVTIALKEFPMFNASFNSQTDEVILKGQINLGMAVDTPDGLIVPNIKNADQLGIIELGQEIRTLADLTIARKTTMDQLSNGTFTITNFGSAGISYGTPIINHPEVAILGIGKISQKPIVENNQIIIGHVLPFSLAVDHRVIDGADGGRFLNRIKELLSNPVLLLLS